jgi:undecaprenyl-diphosphatase
LASVLERVEPDLTERLHEQVEQIIVPPVVARRRGRVFEMIAAGAFATFLTLLAIVRRHPRLEADVVATLRVQRLRNPVLMRLMRAVSWMGFRPQSLLLPLTAIGGLWLIGLRRDARYQAVAWLVSLLSWTTKRLVQRPRPSGEGIRVTTADLRDSSFPSGHALHYTSFWGFFAYLCYARLRGRWKRWLPVSAIGTLIATVGPSRIYLGHHWLSDVLASYSLGTGVLATLVGLHRCHLNNRHR